jgi:hypothetical protein
VPGFGAVLSTRHLALRLMIVNQLDPVLRGCFVVHRTKTAAGLGREHRLYFFRLCVRRSIGAQYRRGMLITVFCQFRFAAPNVRVLNVRFAPIVLQNSKNDFQRFFREKSNEAIIADRCVLRCATEVAGEFIGGSPPAPRPSIAASHSSASCSALDSLVM